MYINVIKTFHMILPMNYHVWRTFKLLDKLNYKSKSENNKRIMSWGKLFGL